MGYCSKIGIRFAYFTFLVFNPGSSACNTPRRQHERIRLGCQSLLDGCYRDVVCRVVAFESIPIPATSMIPLAVFPLVDVLSKEDVAKAYGNDMILLMLSGFMISAALAHSGAHHRLALGLIRIIGGNSSRRIVLGFIFACAMLSMWISNTATTLMMLPLALAVIAQRWRVKGWYLILSVLRLSR